MSARDVRTPSDARFTCQGCGRCCSGWTITLSAEKMARLARHDWGESPFARNSGPGGPYRIRLVKGRCFFLDDDKQCRIHRKLGYEAKPDGCKAFPLHLTEIGGTPYARLSFYCPTVSKNEGKRLVEQQRWIKDTMRTIGAHPRQTPLSLDGQTALSVREVDAIEGLLLAQLTDASTPVADRLLALAAVLQRLRAATRDKGMATLAAARSEAARTPLATLAAEGRQGGAAAKGRTILSLFLSHDAPPRKLARLGHFVGVRLFHLHLAALRSHVLKHQARQHHLRRVTFFPSAEGNALLTRYLSDKIRSRRYLADELSLVQGIHLLCVAYATVEILARLSAHAGQRENGDDKDLRRAIEAADLLVVEHATLLCSSAFAPLLKKILADPSLAASLCAHLGRINR